MSKLKRAFTILMCILLTLPACLVSKPNNVYAATETLALSKTRCEQAGNGSNSGTGSTTLVELGDIEIASVNLSTSVAYNSKGNRQTSASATFYVTNASGVCLKTGGTVSNGSSDTLSIDCRDLTGPGYFKVNFSVTGYTTEGSGDRRVGSASSSNVTVYKLEKPVFSGDFGSGNLTHFKISAF